MRDPNRMPEVLAMVHAVWQQHPDLRLGQLLWYLAGQDPFYMEDDALITRIKQELEKNGGS